MFDVDCLVVVVVIFFAFVPPGVVVFEQHTPASCLPSNVGMLDLRVCDVLLDTKPRLVFTLLIDCNGRGLLIGRVSLEDGDGLCITTLDFNLFTLASFASRSEVEEVDGKSDG